MTKYMTPFDDGDMDFPREDLPDVAKAAHAVEHEAMQPGSGRVYAPGWSTRTQAWSPPTGRSPTAHIRRARSTSADSRSSTWPRARRR